MRRLLALYPILIAATIAHAQLTQSTLSATVIDPNSKPYAYGDYSIAMTDANGQVLSPSAPLTINGVGLQPQFQHGTLDANGSFSAIVVPNQLISPSTEYKVTICSPMSGPFMLSGPPMCFSFVNTVSGNVDFSSQLSALAPVAFWMNAQTGNQSFPGGGGGGKGSGIVSPITNGLLAEYSFQDAAGSTTVKDATTNHNDGTVVGNIGLTGTIIGGMSSAGGTGYVSLPANLTGAVTFELYTCFNALTAVNNPLFDFPIAGLQSLTAPSLNNTRAYGLMFLGSQGNTVTTTNGAYGFNPISATNTTIRVQSGEAMDGCHVVTWVRDNLKDSFFIDGHASKFYQFQNSGSLADVPIQGTLALGGPPYVAGPNAVYSHAFPIFFFNAYSRALTAAEVQANAGAIQASMNARGAIVQASAYADAGNQFLAVGDSITFGFNAVHPYTFYLAPIVPYTKITNIGTPAWQLENMATEATTRGYGSINPNSETTVFLWGGTNDVCQTQTVASGLLPQTPAVAYARLRRTVGIYKAAPNHPRVVVMTALSRAGASVAGCDGIRDTFNNLVRQDFAGADFLFDIASVPAFGQDGASVNPSKFATFCIGGVPCFNGDAIHPSPAGAQTVGTTYANNFLNYIDAVSSGSNPTLQTGATYQELPSDVALNVNPTAAMTVTLPTSQGLVGTTRYISNISAQSITVAAAAGENIDNAATITIATQTKVTFKSVLGATPGLTPLVAASGSGAHWEVQH